MTLPRRARRRARSVRGFRDGELESRGVDREHEGEECAASLLCGGERHDLRWVSARRESDPDPTVGVDNVPFD